MSGNTLFVAWRGGTPEDGAWGPVGMLERADGIYRFRYTKGAATLPGFRPFPGMGDLRAVYGSEELFPIFANRLLSKSRPEYEAYLAWSGFAPGELPDPIAILRVTEGRRQTDAIEVFPCPIPNANGCYETKFFVHGVRLMPAAALERIEQLSAGDRLCPMPDLLNSNDPRAVALRTDGVGDRMLVGYVPRYLAHDLKTLCARCHPGSIHVEVVRVNTKAPLQMRLLCRATACWPEDFRPCEEKAFQPISTVEEPVGA